MPLFEGALGAALLAKGAAAGGAAAGKGAAALAGLLQLQAPVVHFNDHCHGHDHGHAAFSSFLDAHATVAPSPMDHAASQHALHADFLFGSSPSPAAHKIGGLKLLPAGPAAVGALLAAPKMSMLAGVVGGARKLDPFGEGAEGEETGWCKFVPRGLKIVLAADVVCALVLGGSLFDDCDWPLKTWLAGGILLGYPVSYLVQKVASTRPAFMYYRLTVKRLRGNGEPGDFQLEGVVLYDQFSVPLDRAQGAEMKDGAVWHMTADRSGPQLVTGYHLITHSTANAKYDPVSWIFEGSYDGVEWRVLDEAVDQQVPQARNAATMIMDDLSHLEDATSAFRSAFLLDVAANGLAFAWLVAGTAWVSAGTDTCVDSAPLLWCSSYLLVVIVWSFLGTVTIGLIVSAVAMVLLGARPPG